MPQSARKPEPNENPQAETAERYRAIQNTPGGPITVFRMPPRDGVSNTFTFENTNEMTTGLNLTHTTEQVDLVMQELANFGLVEFSTTPT